MRIVDDYILPILRGMKAEGLVSEVFHSTTPRSNVDFGRHSGGYPIAWVTATNSWTLDARLRRRRDRAEVVVAFLTRQPQLDFTIDANRPLTDVTEELATILCSRVIEEQNIRLSEDVQCRTVYDERDENLTGTMCRFVIKEKQGECLSSS